MSKFLNDYMHDFRNAAPDVLLQKELLMTTATDLIWEKIFDRTEPPKLPNALMEALFVGVMKNFDALSRETNSRLGNRWKELRSHTAFDDSALSEGLAKKQKVQERFNAAIEIFSSV